MMTLPEPINQIPNDNQVFKTIKINATSKILEMRSSSRKRILTSRNRIVKARTDFKYNNPNYVYKNNKYQNTCPMRYTEVLCHACLTSIKNKDIYYSKSGEHGRCKYYHIKCAEEKNLM